MLLEFPDDPACDTLDRQYLLGGSLLVAPIFSEEGDVDYYLPAGRWTHLLTGEVQVGGRWYRARHDFLGLPLFVRPGTLLALGACDDRPDYEHARGVRFRLYELADGAEVACVIPDQAGAAGVRCRASRFGRRLEIRMEGNLPPGWSLQLAGVATVEVPAGSVVSADPLGVIVTPSAGATSLRVMLP
jgi:alpha-D-xyloside xylohydrolase